MKINFTIDKQSSLRIILYTPEVYVEPTHWHDCIEIGYCLSGKGRFYFGDKTYAVQPGDVYVVNHLERHIAVSEPEDPSTFLFLLFEMVTLEQIDPDLTMPFIYKPEEFDNRIDAEHPIAQEIGVLMKRIWRENQQKQTAYPKIMRSVLLLICSLLDRYSRETRILSQTSRVLSKYNAIQPALTYIRKNYHEELSLEDVAAQLSLSPSRTRHLFYETIGEGFKTYLLHTRVNEAKRLLLQTDRSITDIYLQCGFQSTASFYRAFKKNAGMSPVEYRERSLTRALTHDYEKMEVLLQ
ncbi:helix-turn-helix domain-containing protein [Paenibacillus allorhizosphaerae]|uniref:Melibiose operon regulatory protein n=1 Tax=Paenibacillus allorhizosphaerae TaxID=2849866 RepID=A0ABM8VB50_9BACL|nr:helix-turn-helix domain-containing protein [Paenibacillus allorhizosphaerae]CAG7618415.1 Melibiose operon regulatory protein [Paenibacillus allorhizosphaerae]